LKGKNLRRVGLKDRLSLMPPKKLKLLGILFFVIAALMFLIGLAGFWFGLPSPPLMLALALPFILMGFVAAGMWLILFASARSSFEKRISKYVTSEELAKIEEEVEKELSPDLKEEEKKLLKQLGVKRRVEALYNAKVEAEFLEALKKRLRFKAGEEILSMVSKQWSGSTLFLFSLPLLLIAVIVLSGYFGWILLLVLLFMALYFSSSNYSVLYIATNRRLIKRVYSSSLFKRSETGEELRWSAVKQFKVSKGRRGFKAQVKGEDEIITLDRLKGEDAEKLIKVIEEQISLAKGSSGKLS